jgi:ribosomal protein S18 acetylase RimI-like enzyme
MLDGLKKDLWFSEIFGKDAYCLQADDTWFEKVSWNRQGELDAFRELLDSKVFIYTKVDSKSTGLSAFLEEVGFRLVDTNVSFEKITGKRVEIKNHIRPAKPEDREQVTQLAGRNFIFSRFHLDPEVSQDVADRIKFDWVGNYFNGKRGDELLVAETDGTISGFVLLLYRGDEAIIDLIAVDSNFRRQGISSDLISYIETVRPEAKKIIVGTQVANIPSVRMYEKSGFRLTASKYIFHYHH